MMKEIFTEWSTPEWKNRLSTTNPTKICLLGSQFSIFTNSGHEQSNTVRHSGESEYTISVTFPLKFLSDVVMMCAVNSCC